MIASEHPQAMFVLTDHQLKAHRMPIVQFAAMNRLPTMYPYRQYVDAGGLMSYAPSDATEVIMRLTGRDRQQPNGGDGSTPAGS
jgi:putative ABC transport system substrate-binding protein